MKEVLVTGGSILVLVTGIFFAGFATGGCVSPPKRKDFATEECYCMAWCIFMNQKNPDKSSCVGLIDECREANKEIRKNKKQL